MIKCERCAKPKKPARARHETARASPTPGGGRGQEVRVIIGPHFCLIKTMPGQLINYGGGANPYYAAGFHIGRKYGPRVAKWAARRIGRAARSYMSRKRKAPYKQVRRLRARMEKPYKASNQSLLVSQTAGDFFELQVGAGIGQGVLMNERIAQQICVRALKISLELQNNQGDREVQFRCMLIKARPGASVANSTQLQEGLWRGEGFPQGVNFNTTGTGTESAKQASTYTINHKRWIMMWQKKIILQRLVSNSRGKYAYRRNHLIKFKKDINLYYQATGSTTFNAIRPGIYLIWFIEPLNANDTNTGASVEVGMETFFCKNS